MVAPVLCLGKAVMTRGRSSGNGCSMLGRCSHEAFLGYVCVCEVLLLASPTQVLRVTITPLCMADEEVRIYPGHCRATIRPGAWSPAPDTQVRAELLLAECLPAGGVPAPGALHTSYVYTAWH